MVMGPSAEGLVVLFVIVFKFLFIKAYLGLGHVFILGIQTSGGVTFLHHVLSSHAHNQCPK